MLSSIRQRVTSGLQHQPPKVPPSLMTRPSIDLGQAVLGRTESGDSAASLPGTSPPSEGPLTAQKGAASFMHRMRTLPLLAPSQSELPELAVQQRVSGEGLFIGVARGPLLRQWFLRSIQLCCLFLSQRHSHLSYCLGFSRSTREDGCFYWQHQRWKAGDDLHSHVPGKR